MTVAIYDGDSGRRCCAAFLAEVGTRARSCPTGCSDCGRAATSGTPRLRSCGRSDAAPRAGHPVGVVVIEAWSDEQHVHGVPRRALPGRTPTARRTASPTSVPRRRRMARPQGHGRRLHERGIRVLLWQIPLLKTRPHPTPARRGRRRRHGASGVLIARAGRRRRLRPYRNRGWWFPRRLACPTSPTEARPTGGLAKRRYLVDEVGIDGFKTDGGEHAWGRDLAYADGTRGDEGNNRYPVAVRERRTAICCARRAGRRSRSAGPGSPVARRTARSGQATRTRRGRRSARRCIAGLTAAACGIVFWGWDLAGFSRRDPRRRAVPAGHRGLAFVPIMQYHSEFNHHRTPSRDRTPWNIAERTGDDRVLPVFRRVRAAARAARALPGGAGGRA